MMSPMITTCGNGGGRRARSHLDAADHTEHRQYMLGAVLGVPRSHLDAADHTEHRQYMLGAVLGDITYQPCSGATPAQEGQQLQPWPALLQTIAPFLSTPHDSALPC